MAEVEAATTAQVILIAGVGTVGSCIAEAVTRQLPHVTLILADHDVVLAHNLGKSALYDEGDVGRYKVHAAAAHLRRIRPGACVIALPRPLETLGAGPFRISRGALAGLDNRPAKFAWNRTCQAAGVPHAWIVELEGGTSLAARLRYYAPTVTGEAGPCLECSWSAQDYAWLNRLGRPCNRPDAAGTPGLLTPALRLAAEVVEEVMRCLVGRPALAPGEELRFLPEQRRCFVLRTPPKADCLCPHGSVRPLVPLDGAADTFRVADLITQADHHLAPGWTWETPQPVSLAVCPACRRPAGWQRLGLDSPPACPDCGQVVPANGAEVTNTLQAGHLIPFAERRLADLWPAGDLLRLARVTGETVWVGLPVTGLLPWLAPTGSGVQLLNQR